MGYLVPDIAATENTAHRHNQTYYVLSDVRSGVEYARYTRVLVKLKSGEWVPGKVHRNRHPDYIIKLDSGYKRKIRCRHIKPLTN